MSYDLHDTIAAIASASGGAARGVVRVSGPHAVELVAQCFELGSPPSSPPTALTTPRRINGFITAMGGEGAAPLRVPGSLLVWPGAQSYTRQPSVEFHTLGSAPLLSAVLEELTRVGVRPARPGEFTLRAFLAGRIDLTQAEGVLGVIDAENREDLDAALDQVAGGLSRPLHESREDLLALLAELEAGLDFVEEDIEFISRQSLCERIRGAQRSIEETVAQLQTRDAHRDVPRVVLAGPPNAGKSRLFNELVARYGDPETACSIVSPQPGATRDYVRAAIQIVDFHCELVDTAGVDEADQEGILQAAQAASGAQARGADLRVVCTDVNDSTLSTSADVREGSIRVITKVDLAASDLAPADEPPRVASTGSQPIRCSSVTGAGIDELAARIRAGLGRTETAGPRTAGASSVRCHRSLLLAAENLRAAADLVDSGSDELLAAELRHALDAIGEIVGTVCADDVLDRVFGQFCIGK